MYWNAACVWSEGISTIILSNKRDMLQERLTRAFRHVPTHRYLRENGVPVSEISGNPPIHGFSWFHFYDPDGNRFNIYRY
jgi:hypothetical protein